jgi:GTPase SAR1 family protein
MDRLERGIRPSDNWAQVLDAALKSSAAVIAVLSPDYLASSYCRDEVEFAFRTKRHLYPVRLQPIDDAARPFWLEGLQFVDFVQWRNAGAYETSLQMLVGSIRDVNPDQLRAPPDAEGQYLNRIVAELRGRRGVTSFFPLLAETEAHRSPVPGEDEFGFAFLRPNIADSTRSPEPVTSMVDVSNFVDEHRRCVLLGDSGAGKTTTLRRLALKAATHRRTDGRFAPIPMVIYLSDWRDESLDEFLLGHWPFKSDLGALLAAGEVIVFLDGLNEMHEQTKLHIVELRKWLRSARGPSRAIFTCRSSDYVDDLKLPLPVVTLQPLGPAEVVAYAEGYLGPLAPAFCAALATRELSALATNPYFLGALIYLYENHDSKQLPVNRGVLMYQLTNALWERERLRRMPRWSPYPALVQTVGKFAYESMAERRGAARDFETIAVDTPGIDAIVSAQLLEMRGSRTIFSHQFIQEYFVAAWLDAEDAIQRCEKFLAKTKPDHGGQHWYWNDKVWMPLMSQQRGVLLALFGISNRRDDLFDLLIRKHPDIAAECAYEGDTEWLTDAHLERIAQGLQKCASYWKDEEVSYGMSSYDGDPEHLLAIYSASDAAKHYTRKSAEFEAWQRRRLAGSRSQ